MFTDMLGKSRLKINLHTHTTLSDGHKTPEEAATIYAAAGYDAIALTDHWVYGPSQTLSGLDIISGCEYHVTGVDSETGAMVVFHIVGLGMERDPELPVALKMEDDEGVYDRARLIIDGIQKTGGMAVLAHPAWSLNTPAMLRKLGGFEATEIYNSVSDFGMSDRPYSGQIVDMLASAGHCYPLLATDDTHHYTGDECRGAVCVEADAVRKLGLVGALRAERFYASMGPEVHLERTSEDTVRLVCSPVVKIAFLSNLVWTQGRMVRAKSPDTPLTEATFTLRPDRGERYVRAEVTDAEGRVGWSNIIRIK